MIPIRDKNPTRRFPVATVVLMVANILVFLRQLSLGDGMAEFIGMYGAVPVDIVSAWNRHEYLSRPMMTLVSSMFLHGGWFHLGGNMLYLWVFGDNVEDKMGRGRFVLFYFLCGIAAASTHLYFDPASSVPMVGASGAVSGVLAAYLFLFPRARVVTVIPIFIFLHVAELPALFVLGFWFALQFVNGMISLGITNAGMGGVAWWAHVGGFAAGVLLVFPFRKFK